MPRHFVLILACMWAGAVVAREHVVLFGTYTDESSQGIYAARLHPETGAFSAAELVAELPNPEFLALHPKGRMIYALTQVAGAEGRNVGAVAALTLDPATGRLRPLNVVATGRPSLCHLAVDRDGRTLIAASYGGGYVITFPLEPDGRVGAPTEAIDHRGPLGPTAARQDAPHPHNVTLSPDQRFAWVADLGLDRVFAYQIDRDTSRLTPHAPPFVMVAAGAGPRHTAFSPDATSFYILDELDNTVTACRYDAERGVAEPFQRVPTLPANFGGRSTTSEIRVHPSGRWVYAANRGHDSLAVFARDPQSGQLALVEIVPCGGARPRNFALSPDGLWLLCGHQDSDTATAFRVDPSTGRLSAPTATVPVPKPVCVLFLPPADA